jgi:hypothetical protein
MMFAHRGKADISRRTNISVFGQPGLAPSGKLVIYVVLGAFVGRTPLYVCSIFRAG